MPSEPEEAVVTPTATRPGRPKGKRYPKDDAGIERRQQRRLDEHRARLEAYLKKDSTVPSTGTGAAKRSRRRQAL